MDIEEQVKLSRQEQLDLPPTVRIDISGAPLLNGMPPIDNPRVYGMTDLEAVEWNKQKAIELAKEN